MERGLSGEGIGWVRKGEEGRDKGMEEAISLLCSKAESSGHDKERDNEGRRGKDVGKRSNEGDGLAEEKEGNGDEEVE